MLTYEQILARQPASTSAGDRAAAKAYSEYLGMVFEQGITHLDDSQRHYLYRLRTLWDKRAKGEDTRWNEYGTRPGRPRTKPRTASKRAYKREEDHDPLLASLLRKYGNPHREDA